MRERAWNDIQSTLSSEDDKSLFHLVHMSSVRMSGSERINRQTDRHTHENNELRTNQSALIVSFCQEEKSRDDDEEEKTHRTHSVFVSIRKDLP